ncbi:MAG TPA: RNA 2',3'-cyclic phosphodiesterase [Vicinamibacterales bacterium]|nr:RNA 2',3'-cyclic phosphodiesterase [Vicinamibacterales bacterium]
MRLFVAIDLDETARQAIAKIQREVASTFAPDRAPKWIRPEQMHLTLAFLGEIAEDVTPPVVEAFSRPLRMNPFAAAFGGLGVFPPSGPPQVLWLGVREGEENVVEVQRQVALRLDHLGIERERRPFHAHLTLGRWRRARSSRRDADRARRSASEPAPRVDVDHVTLYQSRLSPAGPTYAALARATLT